MAEVFVKNNNRSPFVDYEEEDTPHSDVSNNIASVSGKQKKRRSKVDLLEERFDEKNGKLENTLQIFLHCCNPSHKDRVVQRRGMAKAPLMIRGLIKAPIMKRELVKVQQVIVKITLFSFILLPLNIFRCLIQRRKTQSTAVYAGI
ncbi:hypothetical protein DPMN_060204 [Dreissena polymorpha]|uniref:Uncharacterized protein n=1 Tax=Dreissena polymorpha TaxID=45954 RepID=A0A9D4C4S9_DREPO|nr:hypothetical protein DPMN_060204 [Dreissena polymorpha]